MIEISAHSGIYTLESSQLLPLKLDQAWDFFSSPKNLATITPSHMGFHITSTNVDRMHVGQIITYKIGLVPGIKTNWVTEITHVKEGHYFVDEQRFGPYAMWHHEHWFEETNEGVMMYDRVSYKLPLGYFGRLAQPLISKKLKEVFSYRTKVIAEIFSEK